MDLFSGIVLFLSGIGAGVMTGIIGASAVTFMAGILIVFLNYSAYDAIGISLITDVFAALISAHIYKKAKNIDVGRGILIGVFATVFAFIGSIISRYIPDLALNDGVGLVSLITGILFLKNPLKKEHKLMKYFKKYKVLSSILIGIFVGLGCGILGVGGGVTILVVLVFVLGYPIKAAVGTSVLIMAFISLSGGIGHFINRPFPYLVIIIASLGGFIGAIFSSKYANTKISEEKMFKISGISLIIVSLLVIFKKFFPAFGLAIF